MIQAEEFVEAARALGFNWYSGVPCSFLTPFINYVINDDTLNYISSANEGDAVATAAGLATGGKRAAAMMQNSGLGNAVSPLTSLTHVFRIPILLICTHRGAPGVKDEPQHELMGRITGELFETMQIPWEPFPTDPAEIGPALGRADGYMKREQRPYAFIMEKGSVAPHELKTAGFTQSQRTGNMPHKVFKKNTNPPSRTEALGRIVELTSEKDTVLVATTGYTGRELYAIADRPNHLYMVGSMGCASSLGLGLALARPDLHVIIIEGDGAALMRMGNIATLGAYGGTNLTHILLDNEAHDSTGAQATVSVGVSFTDIASGCGYPTVIAGDDVSLLDNLLNSTGKTGPRFGHLKIRTGTIDDLPRPNTPPHDVLRRLMKHTGVPDFG